MIQYHILNGDALTQTFNETGIEGKTVVISEAFIEGPLTTQFSSSYWLKRAEFVTQAYGATREEYQDQFMKQLEILDSIVAGDEVNLWFEDDLFCVTNMWFAVYYISQKPGVKFFRVFPKEDNIRWSGFAKNDATELTDCFNHRVQLNEADIIFSNQLWTAYVNDDNAELKRLSSVVSKGFRFLPEVIQAQIERSTTNENPGRPQAALIEILNEGKTNFYEIYETFWERNSIYGFGDLQVYNMLKEMEIEFSEDIN